MKEEHDEKWLLSKGWNKVKGIRVDTDEINHMSESETFFIPSLDDLEGITECDYYEVKDGEFATDDLYEAIEQQEQIEEDDKK